VKVAIAFVVLYAIFQSLVWMLIYRNAIGPLLTTTAYVAGALFNVTGVPAKVIGNEILLATRTLRIDPDCTGLSLMALYAALVLAYPFTMRRRVIGLAAGLPALLVANMVRLDFVAQASQRLDERAFLFVHDYLFQIVMVGVVIGLWAVYLVSARRHAT